MIDEKTSFELIKKEIEAALVEIKNTCPKLYEHLKESLVMNEENKAFGYFPEE